MRKRNGRSPEKDGRSFCCAGHSLKAHAPREILPRAKLLPRLSLATSSPVTFRARRLLGPRPGRGVDSPDAACPGTRPARRPRLGSGSCRRPACCRRLAVPAAPVDRESCARPRCRDQVRAIRRSRRWSGSCGIACPGRQRSLTLQRRAAIQILDRHGIAAPGIHDRTPRRVAGKMGQAFRARLRSAGS